LPSRLRLTKVTAARNPALEVRVSLRGPDGQARARIRLCWSAPPSAAAVLDALVCRAARAHREGLRVVVESAPAEVIAVLGLAGLGGVDGVVSVADLADLGDLRGQAEVREV
jgi:hypothetical protein